MGRGVRKHDLILSIQRRTVDIAKKEPEIELHSYTRTLDRAWRKKHAYLIISNTDELQVQRSTVVVAMRKELGRSNSQTSSYQIQMSMDIPSQHSTFNFQLEFLKKCTCTYRQTNINM